MQNHPLLWLIDDDESVLDIMARAFKAEHLSCQFQAFNSVSALVAQLDQAPARPSLLLADYYLPDMSGLDLLERLQAKPTTRPLKVVLFSHGLTLAMLHQAEALGVYQVRAKPTSFGQWREFVNDMSAIVSFS